MKNTTEKILIVMRSESFSNINDLKEKISSYNLGNVEYQEMALNEAYVAFENTVNILKILSQNEGIKLDDMLSYTDRNDILNTISQLNQYIINIKNGNTNEVINFIHYTQILADKLNKTGITLKIEWYPVYHDKLSQINYLKKKYEELVEILKSAETIYNRANEILKNAKASQDAATESLQSIQKIYQAMTPIESDIKGLYENIKLLNRNIIQHEADIKNTKSSIGEFFKEIDSSKKDIRENIESIKQNIELNNESTEEIITKNQELQDSIYNILWKTIWTNLYGSFQVKSYWMLWQSIFWLFILIGSIIFLSNSWMYVFENLKEVLKTQGVSSLTLTFYLRFTLIFPAIYAVYFSASEFKNTSRLKEEYDFKSAVAVGLHYYKDLVEKTEQAQDKTFLIDSIKQIFSSPTENTFWKKNYNLKWDKKEKDLTSSLVDICSSIVSKINSK